MRALLLIVILTLGTSHSFAAEPCRHTEDALLEYEQTILTASQEFVKDGKKEFGQRIAPPLLCILEIHEKSDGMLKYLAHNFLQPLLGGSQTAGLLKDRRYQTASEAVRRMTEKNPDVLHSSVLTLHARGSWDFYKGFCEGNLADSCPDFLPDENLIGNQSPLLGSASMLLLHRAYFQLKGKPREDVANRIRNIYRNTPDSEVLKSKTIKEIYREIFNPILSQLAA